MPPMLLSGNVRCRKFGQQYPIPSVHLGDCSFFLTGEQLLYQIPNNKIVTTKIGLLMNLREYERVMKKITKSSK